GLGRVWQRKGDVARSIPMLERGLALSRTWQIRLWVPALAEGLGLARLQGGQVDEALPVLQQAVEDHRTLRGTAGLSSRVAALGQGYLLARHMAEAQWSAAHALELADKHSERGNQAYAHWLTAEVARHDESSTDGSAERFYLDAITLAEALGM